MLVQTEVAVYGGTSAGVCAAVYAAEQGAETLPALEFGGGERQSDHESNDSTGMIWAV